MFGLLAVLWLLNRLKITMIKQAPLGYEDEEGFHFGAEPFEQVDRELDNEEHVHVDASYAEILH